MSSKTAGKILLCLFAIFALSYVAALPAITITATDASASELNKDPGKFTITRTGDNSRALAVYFSVRGTAKTGEDYETITSPVVIPAGSLNAPIHVYPKDDALVEITETIIVTLTKNTSYSIGSQDTAQVNLYDDEPIVTIIATDDNASEFNKDPGKFTITRTGSTSKALTVFFTLSGTATNGVDYGAITPYRLLPAGSSTTIINVSPTEDNLIEGTETIIVALSENSNYSIGNPNTAQVNLHDDESIVTIGALDNNASELGRDPGKFIVSRTGNTSRDLTVYFRVTGTATNGVDYETISNSIVIPAGKLYTVGQVYPIEDSLKEETETIIFTLTGNPNYHVGSQNTAIIYLYDNKPLPTLPAVKITATDANASESGDTGTFTIKRTGDTSKDLTVYFKVSGTATRGIDYEDISNTTTIPAGSSNTTITVSPITDDIEEETETIIVELTKNSSYTIEGSKTATIKLYDNYISTLPTITITATDANASESGDTGTFTIKRTGDTSKALAVYFKVTGTAKNGEDYTTIPTNAIILAGSISTTITVTPINDTLVEDTETIIVELTKNSSYIIGGQNTATIYLKDDESKVKITATDANASELGRDPGAVTITRTGDTSKDLTVYFKVSGTATRGIDYEDISNTTTIPAGSSNTTITVSPITDDIEEETETIIVELTKNSNYTIEGSKTARVYLYDKPLPTLPTVTITATDDKVSELGRDPGALLVSRIGDNSKDMNVYLSVSGSAADGVDYWLGAYKSDYMISRIWNAVVIPAGSSSEVIYIFPLEDSLKEDNETIIVDLFQEYEYSIGNKKAVTVYIHDNSRK